MRILYGTLGLALVLANVLSLCRESVAQQPASPVNSAVESSSRTGVHSYKTEPAELASSAPSAAPADVPTPGSSTPDTKVQQDQAPKQVLAPQATDSYRVGIADELQISVWKEPDLSQAVVVRPDGMITIPVVDDIYVVGLTTKQVQDILTEKLKPVVSEPQVTVIVRNIRSRKVYLVGQVGHPGAVSLSGHETVLQILAESGGPNLYAKSDKIYILRRSNGQEERLNFDYKKAIKGSDPKADFTLVNGDVIVVP
ncbi:MAG: polysaccharide biosynthesis/export family protein [Candidatus Korobacteraceae bacterium]